MTKTKTPLVLLIAIVLIAITGLATLWTGYNLYELQSSVNTWQFSNFEQIAKNAYDGLKATMSLPFGVFSISIFFIDFNVGTMGVNTIGSTGVMFMLFGFALLLIAYGLYKKIEMGWYAATGLSIIGFTLIVLNLMGFSLNPAVDYFVAAFGDNIISLIFAGVLIASLFHKQTISEFKSKSIKYEGWGT